MENWLSRSEGLIGKGGLRRLAGARVAIFGVGGVGSFAAEALARAGVGAMDVIDGDVVGLSNLNRQLIALTSNLGQSKVEVAARRISDINPRCRVLPHRMFYLPETAERLDLSCYDYIADATDMVKGKMELIRRAQAMGIPIISAMGAGNKLDPTAFRVADIYKSSVCPLARAVRAECRKIGIKALKVVYSEEAPRKAPEKGENEAAGTAPCSVSFVPSVAGLIMAGEVIKDISGVR